MGSSIGLRKIILPQQSMEAVVGKLECWGYPAEGRDFDLFGDLPQRLKRYMEGEVVDFPDELDLAGTTHFQQGVWHVTRTILYGETRGYGWVASQSGVVKAARAVGQALNRNPLPIVIPCHRVIGSDGSLGGFSGGVAMKRCLLRLESPRI